jgi:hypothetical protein
VSDEFLSPTRFTSVRVQRLASAGPTGQTSTVLEVVTDQGDYYSKDEGISWYRCNERDFATRTRCNHVQTAVLARIAGNLSKVAAAFLIDDSDQLFSPQELAMMGREVHVPVSPAAARRIARYELPRALAKLGAALDDADLAVDD